jgi:hypothetical protein
MPVYRYSAAAIETIMRRLRLQAIVTGAGLLAVALIAGLSGPASANTFTVVVPVIVVFLGGGLLWSQRRALARNREAVRSTEFELDEEQITARNSLLSTTIRREEVTKLRYLRDGLMVCGKDLRRCVQVRPELDGCDELTHRIEEWVPAGTPRIHSRASLGRRTWISFLVPLVLVGGAMATNRAVASVCSLAAGALMIGCMIWMWRYKVSFVRKWTWPLFVIVAAAMLYRAIAVWTQ